MSKTIRLPRKKLSAGGAYAVGYGKPPKEYQFKFGQSGNPKGRPRGARSEAKIWQDVLGTRIPTREGSKKVSVREGIIRQQVRRALEGDIKAVVFVLNRSSLFDDEMDVVATSLDQNDQEILDSCVREIELKLKGKNNNAS